MARALILICAMAALLAGPATASRGLLASITEADVLNFALNLEYLEANFYKCARDGTPLHAVDRGNGPKPKGCKKAKNLSTAAAYYLDQITRDEITHVQFLRKALGSGAVPQPMIDIGGAFAAAADAAFNTTLEPPFSPYGGDIPFYLGAFIFEDVGVTAYHGGLRALTTDAYRVAAEGIMAVEAYHAGSIRTLLKYVAGEPSGYKGVNIRQVVKAISVLRDAADGTKGKEDVGLGKLAPSDGNAVAPMRTTSGVLRIVYLGGTSKGGFFPEGLNGKINTAA